MRVDEVMTRDVVTASPSTELKRVAPFFAAHHVSGLPVVDRGRLVGVLSETDIVAKETSGYADDDLPGETAEHLRREREAVTVGEAMTPAPVTVDPWASVWVAADLMLAHDVNRLPVVDGDGTLVGIVARNDLVRAFARPDPEIERDIREHLLPSVGLGPNEVDVSVERGIVSIGGCIAPEMARECLRATVHLIPGVVQVEWEVQPPGLVVKA